MTYVSVVRNNTLLTHVEYIHPRMSGSQDMSAVSKRNLILVLEMVYLMIGYSIPISSFSTDESSKHHALVSYLQNAVLR